MLGSQTSSNECLVDCEIKPVVMNVSLIVKSKVVRSKNECPHAPGNVSMLGSQAISNECIFDCEVKQVVMNVSMIVATSPCSEVKQVVMNVSLIVKSRK